MRLRNAILSGCLLSIAFFGMFLLSGCNKGNSSPPENMVMVKGGKFTMGSNQGDADERPAHTVTVNSYFIDKTEVTNAQFCEFLNANGNKTEDGANRTIVEIKARRIQFLNKKGAGVGIEKEDDVSSFTDDSFDSLLSPEDSDLLKGSENK